MKGMDNNAPHGFFGGGSDSYEQMMLMGGGQQGYGGIPSWMGGTPGGFSTSVAGARNRNSNINRRISIISSWSANRNPNICRRSSGGVPVGVPTTFPSSLEE